MKIGFYKETILPNLFVGNFWRIGTFILPYDDSLPTDFDRDIDVNVQFWLYKDFHSYLNNIRYADTIWIKTSLPYDLLNNNAFANIIDKVATLENEMFYNSEIVDLSLPN